MKLLYTLIILLLSCLFATDLDSLLEKGQEFQQNEELSDAIKIFEEILLLDSKSLGALYELGVSHMALGNIERAIYYHEKYQEIRPNYIYNIRILAVIYRTTKQLDLHKKYAKLALDIAKEFYNNNHSMSNFAFSLAYNELGYVDILNKDKFNAIHNFKKSISYDSTATDSYAKLGAIYFALDNELSLKYFKRALQLIPNRIRASDYFQIGFIYYQYNELPNAIINFKKAINIDKSGIFADKCHYRLALIYRKTKGLACDEAIEEIKKAIAINPTISDYHILLGDMYILRGDYDKAMLEVNALIVLNDDYASEMEKIIMVFKRREQRKKDNALSN